MKKEVKIKKKKSFVESLCFGPIILFFIIGLIVSFVVGNFRWTWIGLVIGIVLAVIVTIVKWKRK
jgi:hypothetical protein